MAFDFLKKLFSSNNASRDNKKEELKGRELIHAQLVELTTKCRVTIRSLTKNPESRRNITLKNVHNRLINTLDHLEIAHHSFEDVNKKNINAIIKEIQIANTIINDTSINKRVLAGLTTIISEDDIADILFIKREILAPVVGLQKLKNEL